MRSLLKAALVAALFSVGLSGCYTQLKGPEPQTGERKYDYNEYYGSYGSYWDYYSSFYYRGAWFSPFFYGYPYYSYGWFYSPWWYDPGYYYGGDGYRDSSKSIRSRGTGPVIPSQGFSAPPALVPDNGRSGATRSSDNRSSGGDSSKPSRSSDKSSRGRR